MPSCGIIDAVHLAPRLASVRLRFRKRAEWPVKAAHDDTSPLRATPDCSDAARGRARGNPHRMLARQRLKYRRCRLQLRSCERARHAPDWLGQRHATPTSSSKVNSLTGMSPVRLLIVW